MGDSNRLWGFFAYLSPTSLMALVSRWRRRVHLPVYNGNGATLTEVELLCVDIYTTHMRLNENGSKENGNCELVCDDGRNPERCVPKPNGQPENRAKLKQVAISDC